VRYVPFGYQIGLLPGNDPATFDLSLVLVAIETDVHGKNGYVRSLDKHIQTRSFS
jgi:hypothetical protein